jgi:hypothetical protein
LWFVSWRADSGRLFARTHPPMDLQNVRFPRSRHSSEVGSAIDHAQPPAIVLRRGVWRTTCSVTSSNGFPNASFGNVKATGKRRRRKARANRELTDEEWWLGPFSVARDAEDWIVEYGPEPELRDTERIPFLVAGGIAGFIDLEVRPYAQDAWVDEGKPAIGYEISFTRYFH